MGGGVTVGVCGTKTPSGRDHAELDLGALAGVTDRGRRHPRNEDAMALAVTDTPGGPAAISVVCDGVSASDRPDEASLAGADAAARVLAAALRTGGDPARASADAIAAASDAVTGIADSGRPRGALPAALTDPVAAAGRLVAFALGAGGEDNITAVLARFPRAPASDPRSAPA